jgi:maleamate amidohydrolase
MRRWESIYTEADRKLLQKMGAGQKQTFGKKPAFIIVDVSKAFIGSQPKPLLEAVEEYPTSCGEAGWVALQSIQKLLVACRTKKVPVIFTTVDPISTQFYGDVTKNQFSPEKFDMEAPEIADAIKPLPSELIIRKTKASGFFGTPLVTALHRMDIDCLLFAGTSTSGCLRASVVDACSFGFPCFVVEECCFDRFELSHLVNLWDMNAKYADVITIDEAMTYMAKLP